MPFLSKGPIYHTVIERNAICPDYWWVNLLYINNLYGPGNFEMCASHTWYLANDMQFFILSVIIYILFNGSKVKEMIRNIILLTIFISSLILQYFIAIDNKFKYNDFHSDPPMDIDGYFKIFYIKPWSRISAYLLGIFFYELFSEIETVNPQASVSWRRRLNNYLTKNNTLCYILLIISMILILFASLATYITNHVDLDIGYHALLLTVNKIFFVSGFGMIVHMTFLDKFKLVYYIFAGKIFTIVSRVSYGTYLIHYYILMLFFYSITEIMSFDFILFKFLILTFVILSYIASFIFTLLLDSPLVSLTNKIFKKGDM
jgi:peptidoglycan/LPS O-acetylase OafA/YrhL